MDSVKSKLILCVFAIWVVNLAHAATSLHAPAPAVDCSSLILNMADCLSFVSNDSTISKPEGTCCTGLKTVLKADADCLCQAFRSSAQLGVVLNVTKALSLPAACKVSAPAAANCGLSVTPAAPAFSPESSPESATAAAPSAAVETNGIAPAPAPGSSSSSVISMSIRSLIVGLGAALLSTL